MFTNIPQVINSLPKGKHTVSKLYGSLHRSTYADPWLFKDDNVYRMFYLFSKETGSYWWRRGEIHGAISTDLKKWKHLGPMLKPEPNNSWEAGRLCAGFIWKENGIYYLFYSAAGKDDNLMIEGIGLATSVDGLNWERYSNEQLLNAGDNPYYDVHEGHLCAGRYYNHFQWRDPYIVKEHNTGKYYMFFSAYQKEGKPSTYRGCVGVAVADQITGPYEVLPPATTPFIGKGNHPFTYEMERPQVIYRNGKYHMFFSAWDYGLNPEWLKEVHPQKVSNSCIYWYVSDNITGPFKPVSDLPFVKGSDKTGLYATNFLYEPDQPDKLFAYGWYTKMYKLGVANMPQAVWKGDYLEIK